MTTRTAWFLGGVLLLFLDLASPLDALANTLFSAHIAQQFILALIVPILLVLGTPRSFQRLPVIPGAVSWLAGVGTMLGWHVPALFNAALANEGLHMFQHLTFLATGVIFWWPILAPAEDRRLAPLPAIVYLFTACTACSLLGAILTFSPPGAYPAYLHPGDPWGLDAKTDQQLGGMLMWVPGCLVYLSAILATFARWHRMPEREAASRQAMTQRP